MIIQLIYISDFEMLNNLSLRIYRNFIEYLWITYILRKTIIIIIIITHFI